MNDRAASAPPVGMLTRSIPLLLHTVLLVTVLPYFSLSALTLRTTVSQDQLLLGTLFLLFAGAGAAREPHVVLGLVFADTAIVSYLFASMSAGGPFLPFPYFILMMLALLSDHARYTGAGVGVVCTGYIAVLLWHQALSLPYLLMVPVLLLLAALVGCHAFRAEVLASRASRIEQHVAIDALTGLPNRAAFLDRVWDAMQYARRFRDEMFAVLFIDLDGFKPINDRLGHRAGDDLLKGIAGRLRLALRKGDCIARYGGDEFCVLLSRVQSRLEAIRAAERLLEKVKAPVVVGAGQSVSVGASIGIALSTNIHSRPEDLIRDADAAMYRVKVQGKNGVSVSEQLADHVPAVAAEPSRRA